MSCLRTACSPFCQAFVLGAARSAWRLTVPSSVRSSARPCLMSARSAETFTRKLGPFAMSLGQSDEESVEVCGCVGRGPLDGQLVGQFHPARPIGGLRERPQLRERVAPDVAQAVPTFDEGLDAVGPSPAIDAPAHGISADRCGTTSWRKKSRFTS